MMLRIKVRAKKDTDFCKKGDIVSMRKGVFEEYHKKDFEIVGEKKEKKETKIEKVEEKIPTKKNKAIKFAKNK